MTRVSREPRRVGHVREIQIDATFAMDMTLHFALNTVRAIKDGKPVEEIERELKSLLQKSPRLHLAASVQEGALDEKT